MSKENKKPKLIIPSKEDIKRNEQIRKDIEWLKKQLLKGLRIPRKYFDSNPDDK